MAKRPRRGSTKTRLCPPLTPAQAVDLYSALLADTITFVTGLPDVQPAIAVTPAQDLDYFVARARGGMALYPVEGRDIGGVLDRVLTTALAEGHPKAMAIHSDGPTFRPEVIAEAIGALETQDVVLGPCDDGGYYLVGLKRACPQLFEGIEWSTPRVTQQTLARARQRGLAVHLLPEAMDVDTGDDLARLSKRLGERGDLKNRLPHTRACVELLDIVSDFCVSDE
jgi:rSAM/selenodomain-associated transferase 1